MTSQNRILLLEDDPDDSRRCQDTLASYGYSVTVAASLAAARRKVRDAEGFELVIVDHHLPDGEGPSIIPALRAAGIHAPVVLVTGDPRESIAEAAYQAGCADCAVKSLEYHLWLPQVAQTFIDHDEPGTDGDFRWGPHVQGLAVGRLSGREVHGQPAGMWQPWASVLQSATDTAIRGLRSSGQHALGSNPVVHLQLKADLHLALAVRGGVFAAALLSRAPKDADIRALLSEAADFAKARGPPGDFPDASAGS